MPFAFAIVGIVFLIAGVRGKSDDLLSLLQNDLRGSNNFIYWILTIAILGSIGYIKDLQPFSRAFLVLVIVVLIISEDNKAQGTGGFFVKFQQAVSQITQSPQAAA
jgi:hypothetical protein